MSKHSDMLKELLKTKKGTAANREAKKEAARAFQGLVKTTKRVTSQVAAVPVVKTTARGT